MLRVPILKIKSQISNDYYHLSDLVFDYLTTNSLILMAVDI